MQFKRILGFAAVIVLLTAGLSSLGQNARAQTQPWQVQQQNGQVLITVQGAGHVFAACRDGYLNINGAPPAGGPIACAQVRALTLQGDAAANWLDAGSLSPADFPALQRVTLDGGAGDDTLTASPFTDVLAGGAGSDVFVGVGGEDQTDAGADDFFMEATLPLGGGASAPVKSGAASPAPASPAAETSFAAIDFDTDGANSGYYHIPPDPMGAVGPNHVVNVVNTSIEWYTRSGTQQNSQRLGRNATTAVGSFFESLSPVNGTFDPKVLYDQYAGRFVVLTLEKQDTADGDPVNSSRILLAVSDDSDPNGTWYYTAINSSITIGTIDTWADYPGFAVDDKAIYITANMFGYGSGVQQGQYVWIVDKGAAGGFYAGGSASVTAMDAGNAYPGTIQPAHTFGAPPAGMGTYLTLYSGLSGGGTEYVYVGQVSDPLGTPSIAWSLYSLGDIDDTTTAMPDAPQNGTTDLVDSGDRRTLNAVWRNNALWTVFNIVPGSGADTGQATAHWVKLNANGGAVSLADQGSIGGEDIASGTYTFLPSVMVDSCGNMAVGFAASGSSIYPGAYYAARFAADPAGTVQAAGTLAAGLDVYHRTFGAGRNRWGDYTGIALDPVNESAFWVYNEYAMARNGSSTTETGRWATQWGSFDLGCADVNVVLSEVMFNSASINGSDESPYEWVEIYNKGSVPVDLSNWSICDELLGCDPLSGVIPAGEYWLIANNAADLTTELANYGGSPDSARTIYLGGPIGNNGLTNSGDAVYLLNGGAYCGSGTDACTVDCVSWDSANTCAALIAAGARSYLPGADGYDSTALTTNEQNGQSVVNIQGVWYQSGPASNTANQASPYQYNVAEGGTPTALTLRAFRARSGAPMNLPLPALPLSLASLTVGGLLLRRRSRRTRG